jgi:predicted nucleic acid-binding protein
MKSFFDTSSLVKRYIQESGSAEADEIFISSDSLYVSSITQIELTSALTRRLLEKSIGEKSYGDALKAFRAELKHFEIVPFNSQIEKYAIRIIEKHGMKTLDAIQLSSAMESNTDQFVTSDKRLFEIASKVTGLKCLFI